MGLAQWFRPVPAGDIEPEVMGRLLQVTPAVWSAAAAVTACYYFLDGPAGAAVTLWLWLFVAISLARIAVAQVHAHTDPARRNRRRWLLWSVGCSLVHALQWCSLAVILHQPGSIEAESVLHIVLASVAMGAAVHLSVVYPVLATYVLFVIGPLVLRDLMLPSGYHRLMAVLCTLIAVYALLNGRSQSRTLAEVMTQRRRNAELVDALRAENERSEAARRTAEAASAARSRFFAAANHDLRQPLHAMGLLANTLTNAHSAAEVREVSTHLSDCVEGMTQVVDDLLEITRMDAGTLTPQRTAFALGELVGECCRPFAALARAKGLRLAVEVDPGLVVHSDRAMLARVVANLVSNAIRYTRAGTVSVSCRPAGEGALMLRVEDTGIGIALEHQPLIFEEFYQVSNPARDRRLGLGLGLATVKRLSDLLGLAVRVGSTPGTGSVFTLTLPLADTSAAAAVLTAEQAAPVPSLGTGRVLLIEDDADSREALARLLQSWGCDVQATPALPAALALLREGFTPDVLLADLRLADGASGIDAACAVRDSVSHKLTVAIVTGDVGSAHMQAAQAAGLTVIVKPVRPIQLRAFLSQALARA